MKTTAQKDPGDSFRARPKSRQVYEKSLAKALWTTNKLGEYHGRTPNALRIIILFALLMPLFVFAGEKIYIEPAQIGFSNKEIFVHVNGKWESVTVIHSDNSGLYVLLPLYCCLWKCSVCGTINDRNQATCITEGCTGRRPPKYSIPKPPRPILSPFHR